MIEATLTLSGREAEIIRSCLRDREISHSSSCHAAWGRRNHSLADRERDAADEIRRLSDKIVAALVSGK